MISRAASPTVRLTLLAALSLSSAGCELVGDIFQAGFVVGLIIVVLVIAIIAWIMKRFRGRVG